MEHFRHRPQAGKTILAVYGGWKLNGFASNSKRFFSIIERFLQRIPKTVKWFLDMIRAENIVGCVDLFQSDHTQLRHSFV
ncbi:hypothetical protein CQ052_10055 [Ochrobactrum sp. MYb15]|uniref:Uncharacterized protein n=1 Tax=Brucella pituitosa TaxID=571256 RepID=A0A643ETB3_9HYPH|nr:hypothetical protein F7Q93_23540 [Brucella pituitosa]PQZ46414.1 hypothetical protein CQZ90_21365 [Ochrobactrum sp. MYb19]PRA47263.1 hypothetical protein CQ062_23020 [Ochrobactrum sp. MYb68]PRA60388.1 hypothetical protein CQ053_21445 [Ochrobactrum sp. MYb18]PRA77614.1 hypothetical protein CQ049_10055 [Brucella thiophenivorans]PRA85009.1 hypothetical protein CQ051_21375 [Ochrobactrum sp. MYb14]PRA99624.1 hypothetical protein CQ052_10055 [Ochrobactrum sp. MYb15]